MIKIQWPDKHIDQAETMEQLHDNLARGYRSWIEFRIIMIRRAKKWSNTPISPIHTKAGFIEALAKARMFKIVER